MSAIPAMNEKKIHIYGRGKLGSALSSRALDAGVDSLLLSGRGATPPSRHAHLIILAIPDGAVEETMRALDAGYDEDVAFVHVAGTLPSRMPLPSGRPTGGMHPLISFASNEHLARLSGRTFTLRGDAQAIERARDFVLDVGGIPLVHELSGPAYHASAALLANGAVALADRAASILDSLGVESAARNLALAGLLESVADNLRELGPSGALTGPIARGDVSTVEAHRLALSESLRRDYDSIGSLILSTALKTGLDEKAVRAISDALAQPLNPED